MRLDDKRAVVGGSAHVFDSFNSRYYHLLLFFYPKANSSCVTIILGLTQVIQL